MRREFRSRTRLVVVLFVSCLFLSHPVSGTDGTLSTGTFTISGSVQQYTHTILCGEGWYCDVTEYDNSGSVSVSVGSFTATSYYDQGSWDGGIAADLASQLNASSSPVTASVSGLTITVTAKTTANNSLPLAASSVTYDTQYFSSPSFTISKSGATLTGGKIGSSTSLASTPNPSNYGNCVTFTGTVSPSAATGTVTFKDGATTLGTSTLASGTATLSSCGLAAGSHSMTASYNGDSAYVASTSTTLTQTMNKAASSVVVAGNPNPSSYGASVTFTATVTPSSCTGSVTFKDGATTLGTGTISGGSATYSTSALAFGSHSITGSYNGDSNCNSSTSATLTQTVTAASTTTSLTSTPNPSNYGSCVTFTGTVSPSAATGTVTFKDGAVTVGTSSLAGGTATLTSCGLAAGSHSMAATYNGDSTYASSTSTTLTQTVNKATPSVVVAGSPNPSAFGASVTFTATATPSSCTGSVTFKDGATTLGTGTISGGSATYSASALGVGSHSVTGSYNGDSNCNSSTSATLTQTVTAAGTTTSLTSTPNPSNYGSCVTFTGTVSPSAATGTVTFKDGAVTVGTSSLAGGTATLTSCGLAAGSHSMAATYNGDSTYASSTSTTLTQTVNKATPSVVVAGSPNPSAFGASVTFTATATPSSCTGSVTFKDGATTLGTGTISGGSATYSASALGVGSHSITGSYNGDSNCNSSTSATLTQTVTAGTTTVSLTSTPNPSNVVDSVTLRAVVDALGGTPTGSATFKDGATTLGSGALSASSTTNLLPYSNGFASWAINAAALNGLVTDPFGGTNAQSLTLQTSANNSEIYDSVNGLNYAGQTFTASGWFQAFPGEPLPYLRVEQCGSPWDGFESSAVPGGSGWVRISVTGAFLGSDSGNCLNFIVRNATTNAGAVSVYGLQLEQSNVLGPYVSTTSSARSGSGAVATFSATSLSLGTHSMTASYSGDSTYAASTSTTLTQTVDNKLASSVVVAGYPNPSTFGASVTFMATVMPSSCTGSVTFKDGAATLGTGAISGGAATFSTSALAVGSHSIRGSYNGDSNCNSSTSATLTQTVSSDTLSTGSFTISGGVQQYTYTSQCGEGVYCENTVYDSGSVSVSVGHFAAYSYYGEGSWDAGIAADLANQLNAGSPVTATVNGTVITVTARTTASNNLPLAASSSSSSGDSHFYGASFTVSKSGATLSGGTIGSSGPTTTISLTSTASNPSTYGNCVTFTGTVSPSAASGTVTFTDGATTLGTSNLVSGTATLSSCVLAAGSHAITASYSGDTAYAPSTSAIVTQGVTKSMNNVVIASSPNPSSYGTSVTFTASVPPSTCTGSVTFRDGTITLGTGTISGGSATYSTSALAVGPHSISGLYNGDSNCNALNSPALSQTVTIGNTTVSLTSADPNPSNYGSCMTFCGTVAPSAATGTVTFKDGATTLGTSTLASGTATLPACGLAVGSHPITATYNGGSPYASSNSTALTQTVSKAASSVVVVGSPNPSAFGASVTFTATVTLISCTGAVTFKDGATTLGTGTMSGGAATYSTSALAVGSHSITASYSGDSDCDPSTPAPLPQTVTAGTTTVSLTSTPNPSNVVDSVTLRAVVDAGGGTPTGSATLKDGATTLGTVALSASSTTNLLPHSNNFISWAINAAALNGLVSDPFGGTNAQSLTMQTSADNSEIYESINGLNYAGQTFTASGWFQAFPGELYPISALSNAAPRGMVLNPLRFPGEAGGFASL